MATITNTNTINNITAAQAATIERLVNASNNQPRSNGTNYTAVVCRHKMNGVHAVYIIFQWPACYGAYAVQGDGKLTETRVSHALEARDGGGWDVYQLN